MSQFRDKSTRRIRGAAMLLACAAILLCGCGDSGESWISSAYSRPEVSQPPEGAEAFIQRAVTGIDPSSDQAGFPLLYADESAPPEIPVAPSTKEIGRFLLTRELNPGMPFTVACYWDREAGTVSAVLPAGVDRSILIPTFDFYGQSIEAGGAPLTSGVTVLDMTEDIVLTLKAQDGSAAALVLRVENLETGLPSFSLTTGTMMPIENRTDYVDCSFYLGGGNADIAGYAAAEPYIGDGQAKGRGNTSWNEDKKGYTVKLAEKAAFLDMSESRDWTLIPNHEDKSLLRNYMAMFLAEQAGIEVIMKARPVDFWYNGRYWGTYNLTEKIEVEKDRVDIVKYDPSLAPDQVGYLSEFDGHVNEVNDRRKRGWERIGPAYYDPVSNEVFFQVDIGSKWLTIKKPGYEELTLEHINYFCSKVADAVDALNGGSYADIDALIDVRSFVKWYLVEELTNNADSSMHSSVYMTLDAGGKFRLGPVWDFDRSSGNCDYWNAQGNIDSLYTSHAGWFRPLFAHKQARDILREDWENLYPRIVGLSKQINRWGSLISVSAHFNFTRWPILDYRIGSNPAAVVSANTFEKQLTLLKDYMDKRMAKFETFIQNLS